jgi:hypothetical protein
MKPFCEASGQELVWVHTEPVKRLYELRFNTNVVAALYYPAAFGTVAIGKTVEEQWTFDRVGILRPHVTARATSTGSIVATVKLPFLGWGGGRGEICLPDGRIFHLVPSGVGFIFVLSDSHATVVFRFKRPVFQYAWTREGKLQTQLDIAPTSWSIPELALLALLAQYLIGT